VKFVYIDLHTEQLICPKSITLLIDNVHFVIIILIIKVIYTGSPKGRKCAMLAAEVSTVYRLSTQLNRNVFSCVLKVSTETLFYLQVDCFHVDGTVYLHL